MNHYVVRRGVSKWLITLAVIATTAVAALSAQNWVPLVASFVTTNTETLQGLEALVQLALWTLAGVVMLVGVWRTTRQYVHRNDQGALPGLLPPFPSLVVGREQILETMKRHLRARCTPAGATRTLVVTGWPGVGKSTVAAALAHDKDLRRFFPGPILWATLGSPHADVRSHLRTWGRAVEIDLNWANNDATATAKLAAHLAGMPCLLLVDDVWTATQVQLLRVGDARSAMIFTTRQPEVALALAPTPADIVHLPGLTTEDGVALLSTLAPDVVHAHGDSCRDLVGILEGLPLALQVAGRLLSAEWRRGLDVQHLLMDLKRGRQLLEATAPADMASGTTPTLTALLTRSTQDLDAVTLERFAVLGVMAGRETHFDRSALQTLWDTPAPDDTVRFLVDRGLLEFDRQSGRYRMHSLLLMHARALLQGNPC